MNTPDLHKVAGEASAFYSVGKNHAHPNSPLEGRGLLEVFNRCGETFLV